MKIESLLTLANFTRMGDLFIIALLCYFVFYALKGTKALNVIIGLGVLLLVNTVAIKINLILTAKVLSYVFEHILILLLIIFQEDIRRGISRIAISIEPFKFLKKNEGDLSIVEMLASAAFQMGENKTGAIIVIEKDQSLQDFISTGILLNAYISEELLLTIFDKNTILHDGAVIIDKDKIISASSVLPLTNKKLNSKLGTRHRAAIGITEDFDCVSIVVSEETGDVKIVSAGELVSVKDRVTFVEVLKNVLKNKKFSL